MNVRDDMNKRMCAPVVLAVGLCLPATTASATNDKVIHALAGATTYAATGSLGACVAAGVGKEVYDSTGRGTVEVADAVATILPCIVMHVLRGERGVQAGVQRHEGRPVSREERRDLIRWANERHANK